MTVTEYGWCPTCDERRELVMNETGFLQCHACGNMNIFDSKQDYDEYMEEVEQNDPNK